MKVAIGSDKSGFSLKEAIKTYLKESLVEFEDLGTIEIDVVKPYFEVASKVAKLVQKGEFDRAILICGTGAGMNIVANKYKGIHAVACEGVYSAKMAASVNGANVLCMGGWIVPPEMGVEMTKIFLETQRFQDLEDWRIGWLTNADNKIKKIEEDIYG